MRWSVRQAIEAAPDDVLAAALDDATLHRVPEFMPLVASARRVERRRLDDGRLLVVDRFTAAFDPPPFARGVTRDMLGWDLRLTWDLAAHAATFEIDPHVKPAWKRYASARGLYALEGRGARCERTMDGDLTLHVPLVGSLAERFALRTLTEQFAGEARLLEASARDRARA